MSPFRARRPRIKIAKGIHVNLGKRGPSLSLGGKVGRVTMGPSGTRRTIRGPLGLSYTSTTGRHKSAPAEPPSPGQAPARRRRGCLGCAGTAALFAAFVSFVAFVL